MTRVLQRYREFAASKSDKLTDIVVAAMIGGVLVVVALTILKWPWNLVALVAGAYEAWALANNNPDDTITEGVIRYSTRPFVPWLFGLATGWAIATGYMHNVWVILSMGFLQGHFFMQLQRSQEKAEEKKAVEAIQSGVLPDRRNGRTIDADALDDLAALVAAKLSVPKDATPKTE